MANSYPTAQELYQQLMEAASLAGMAVVCGGSHLVLATHSRQVGRRIQQFMDELKA